LLQVTEFPTVDAESYRTEKPKTDPRRFRCVNDSKRFFSEIVIDLSSVL
jgi:hypothetical protein